MAYVPRLTDSVLADLLQQRAAGVLLVGPRASGKTTSARQFTAGALSLDRPSTAGAVRADPDAALDSASEDPLLIDEWQLVPEILGAAKRSLDAIDSSRHFVLTGSAGSDQGPAGWPMTGRVIRMAMWGFSERELAGNTESGSIVDHLLSGSFHGVAPGPALNINDYCDLALRGMSPEIALTESETVRQKRLRSYIDQLVTRDQINVHAARDPRRLRSYLASVAANTAGTVQLTTLLDATGLDRATAGAYDSLLELLFITQQVPVWSTNRVNRIAKLSKRYLTDAAYLGPLLGVNRRGLLRDVDLVGRVIDTFVLSQLRSELEVCTPGVEIFHLRTDRGRQEVDLILESPDGRVVGIEVKATASPELHDARHLVWLQDALGDDFASGVVFHTGEYRIQLAENIVALPISTIWGRHEKLAGDCSC